MNLNYILSKEEEQAVKNFIAATVNFAAAEDALDEAKREFVAAAKEVSRLYWVEGEEKESITNIPESFVVYFGGKPYIVNIDVEGNHAHEARQIAGVIGFPGVD